MNLSSVFENHLAHPAEEVVEHVGNRLRCGMLAHRREAHDVAEHDRDIPLLGHERPVRVAFQHDPIDHARRVVPRQALTPFGLVQETQ